MRKALHTGLLVFALSLLGTAAKAQTFALNYFSATPDGSDMLISWELPSEDGVTLFKLYRKINDEPDFTYLDQIEPNGTRKYEFFDYTLYRGDPRTITYKLQVYKNGMVYAYSTSVLHNPTSVQRTWGSIKAMFR